MYVYKYIYTNIYIYKQIFIEKCMKLKLLNFLFSIEKIPREINTLD